MNFVNNFGVTPFKWAQSPSTQQWMTKKLIAEGGLKVSNGSIQEEFFPLLIHLISKPELSLYAQVYFDTFSLSRDRFPTFLYMLGFGHMMEQHMVANTHFVAHFKHQTVFQPLLRNSCDKLPTLGHNPKIVFKLNPRYLFPEREIRRFSTNVETDATKFFKFLSAANFAARQCKWLESYAYSLASLDCEVGHVYRASAFCNLAISMAHLSISSKMTWFALEKAACCHQFIGQQYEWMCAFLQILISFGLFEEEKKVFEYCKDFIPELSAWYETLLDHHLTGLVHQFENNLGKCFIEFHTCRNSLFEFGDVSLFNQLLKEIALYSHQLKVPGAKEYYQGLGLIFKSLIKEHKSLKNKYFTSGKEFLKTARNALQNKNPKKLQVSQLLAFLDNDIDNVEMICNDWRVYTSCYFNMCAAEFWLKCALITMSCECDFFDSMWIDTHEMTFQAKEEYIYSTFSYGYRLDMLTALNKFHEPQQVKSETKIDLFKASQNFKIVQVTDILANHVQLKSRHFVHTKQITEQAYKLGFLICNKTRI